MPEHGRQCVNADLVGAGTLYIPPVVHVSACFVMLQAVVSAWLP